MPEGLDAPEQGLTLHQAADALGVHYMTAYRYVRTGRLPASRLGGTWRVDAADLDLLRRPAHGETRRETGLPMSRGQLQSRLIAGDEVGAWSILESALGSGTSSEGILLDLLAPVLVSIGRGWESGELSVADEHRATSVTLRLIGRLGARFARRGRKRGTVVLAAPPGEQHGVPVAIAADLLRWRGFEVVELGADTPADTLAATVARNPDLIAVGIACTTRGALRTVRKTIAGIHREAPGIPVILGGAAIHDAEQARALGADLFTGGRADAVISAVEALVNAEATPAP
jgi:excisionase family DNA binding protein